MTVATPRAIPTRIQANNRKAILKAALAVFSARGYRAATVDQIAAKAEMSKPNLLYYFHRKEAIYIAVLEQILQDWLKPLERLNPEGEPIAELSTYIATKMTIAVQQPEASRLFANEILHGAPVIGEFLRGRLREQVAEKAAVIAAWSKAGKLRPVDPYHLIFMIWAVTQHYADFSVQVEAVLGETSQQVIEKATAAIKQIILYGVVPDNGRA